MTRRTAAEAARDLPVCQVTEYGQRLLRGEQAAGVPERHGLCLHFDALTGDHVPQPPRLLPKPARPLVEAEQLPQRIATIGLDRARALARAQGEPLCQGATRIRCANVRREAGKHVWGPVELLVEIARDGALQVRLQNGTPAQQAWLGQRDLGVLGELATATTQSWANGRCHDRPAPVPVPDWCTEVDHLLSPEATLDEVRGLIHAARAELVLHAGWLDAPDVEPALAAAAGRGVRCYISGGAPALAHWTENDNRPPGFVATAGAPDPGRPLAIVADRGRALRARWHPAETAEYPGTLFVRAAGGNGEQIAVVPLAYCVGGLQYIAAGDPVRPSHPAGRESRRVARLNDWSFTQLCSLTRHSIMALRPGPFCSTSL